MRLSKLRFRAMGVACAMVVGMGPAAGAMYQPCPWDCADPGDGSVATADLLALLSQWGGPGSCDFNGDGTVTTSDLLKLLSNWGVCP